MSASPDPDLRDVFKLLYEDDDDADWAMSDEEDGVSCKHPPSRPLLIADFCRNVD
jgi:hypothetical protein